MVNAAHFAGLGLGFNQIPQIICSPLPFYHIFGILYFNNYSNLDATKNVVENCLQCRKSNRNITILEILIHIYRSVYI